jgi:soluble lytic murein transglycosylase-like protein
LFAQYAGAYGVDKNILERIANCESHFNANSQNKDYLGMFQFSTSTWQKYRMQMGLDANPALRTNIEESIKTAAFVVQQRGIAPWPSCL